MGVEKFRIDESRFKNRIKYYQKGEEENEKVLKGIVKYLPREKLDKRKKEKEQSIETMC